MRFKRDLKKVNMKKLFRRNQIIVTTLAVMIAAAGYLNYTGKQDLEAGNVMSEAGMMEISDEDILMENQKMLDGTRLGVSWRRLSPGQRQIHAPGMCSRLPRLRPWENRQVWRRGPKAGMPRVLRPVMKIRGRLSSPAV